MIIFGALLLGIVILILTSYASGASSPLGSQYANSSEVDLEGIIKTNAARWEIEVALIKAIIRRETNFNIKAVNPSDPSYGVMQITPILAQTYGIVKDYKHPTQMELAQIMAPEVNVNLGSQFLSYLTGKYPFDIGIQMYNVGEAGYNSGRRASAYLADVKRFYNEYKSG